MKKLIIRYKNFLLKVHASEGNTCIIDSYKIKSVHDMKSIINSIKSEVSDKYAINKRSVSSMIHEWRVHNLIYSFNILRSRVKDVDLNINQPWYIQTLYFILSPFYLHFK